MDGSIALDELVKAYFVNVVVHVCAISILVYDHLITLAAEVEHVWCRPKRTSSFVFLVFRYLALLLTVADAALASWNAPLQACKAIWLFNYVSLAVIVLAVGVIMSQRVYAIFGCDKRVLCGFAVYVAIGLGVAVWVVVSPTPSSEPEVDEVRALDGNKLITQCPLPVSNTLAHRLAIIWIMPMGYDITIFGMTVYKTVEALRQPHMSILHLLLRDGAMYFGVTSFFKFVNVLTFYELGPRFGGLVVSIGNSISVALVSRMMLHLHEEIHSRMDSDNGRSLATMS